MMKKIVILLCMLCVSSVVMADYEGDSIWIDGRNDIEAEDVTTDTTNFDTNLSSADTTVQKALETLDELAGGGVTDHTALSNLAWTSSGHTGTASTLAGFAVTTGSATTYTESNYSLVDGTRAFTGEVTINNRLLTNYAESTEVGSGFNVYAGIGETYVMSSDYDGSNDSYALSNAYRASYTRTGTIDGYGTGCADVNYGIYSAFVNEAIYSSANDILIGNIGLVGDVVVETTFDNAGAAFTQVNTGVQGQVEDISVLTSGTLETANIALDASIDSSAATGIITNIGLQISGWNVSGSETNWGIYDDTGYDWKCSGAITSSSLNTGQGDNELYGMNQNVETTSSVTFASVTSSVTGNVTGDITGSLTLGVSDTISIDSTPDTDDTWTGDTITATAGENLVKNDVCYLKSDGKFWKADGDAESTTKGTLAMATASITADATGVLLTEGYMRDDGDFEYTVGAELYVPLVQGDPTETIPPDAGDFVRSVGSVGETKDIVHFKPSEVWVERK